MKLFKDVTAKKIQSRFTAWALTAALAVGLLPAYVKAEDTQQMYYGTTTLTYTEYYAGDTSLAEYDAVTSATTSKYSIFPNESISEVTEDGYSIYGVSNVPVAVSAEVYEKAQEYKEAGTLDSADAVYQKAAQIALNEDKTVEVSQYKTLQEDGTYSATKQNVVATVADAQAVLKTTSVWGAYEVDITETSTAYIRNERSDDGFAVNSNIMGIIVETTDGTKVGLRYTEEIWVQPYEFSFNLNTAAAENLIGKTISKVSYLMPDETYVYTFDGIYLKPQAPEGSVFGARLSEDYTSVELATYLLPSDMENIKVSVYQKEGRTTTYYAQDAEIVNGTVALETPAAAPEDTDGDGVIDTADYTVILSSDTYADVSTTIAAQPTDINAYEFVIDAVGYVANGEAITPAVGYAGTDTLVEGQDYAVSYANNVEPGTATITINGMGAYTGTVTLTFTIDAATVTVSKVKNVTAKSSAKKKVKVTYSKVSNAETYEIRYATKKSMKKAATVTASSTSKTIKKLKSSKKYYVQVRAVASDGTKGAWSAKASVKVK